MAPIGIVIDLNKLKEMSRVALRRASSFARFGLDGLEDKAFPDFNLSASMTYQFWPAEISDQSRRAAKDEYRSWLIGSCIRELDQLFNLFLDQAWFYTLIVERAPNISRMKHSFERQTNVAAKQQAISERLNIQSHYDSFCSLSLARNALTHGAGHVREPFDCNSDCRKRLQMNWSAWDVVFETSTQRRRMVSLPFDTSCLGLDEAVTVSLERVIRIVSVPAGAKLTFTTEQLAELCGHYRFAMDEIVDGIFLLCAAKGILGGDLQGATKDQTGNGSAL